MANKYLDETGVTYLWNKIKNEDYKSLYNLGAYDTISGNVITRQTGYIVLDGVENKFRSKSSTTNNGMYYIDDEYIMSVISKPSDSLIVGDIICNLFETKPNDYLYRNNVYGISLYTNGNIGIGLTTSVSTLDEANAYLAQNPISIQYKLATATTEKVEKNHYARYNQRFILEHNKSEAERSCNLLNTFDRSNIPSSSSLYNATLNSDGSYTSTATSDGRDASYSNTDFRLYLKKGTYTFSASGTISSNTSCFMKIVDTNGSDLCYISKSNDFKLTFTLTSDINVGVQVKSYDSTNLKLMLNEGSIALPYQPYNQNKHITNNEALFLKTESDRSANLFDANNAEYGSIDENGEDFGTGHARARSIYIRVLPNTYYSIRTNNSSILIYELYQYDSNKSYIAPYTDILEETYTFLTRNNTYYIRILFRNPSNTEFNLDILSKVMLNEGSVALPYQPYEGKVVHEKGLGEKLNSYVDVSSTQVITGEKRFSFIGVDLIKSSTTGDALFTQNQSTGDVSLGAVGRSLHFVGNQDRPLYSKDGGTSYRNLALLADIPTFKTINGNSIVGSGDMAITADSVFTEVTDVVDTFTINRNGTWLITCLGYNKIYASDNSTISFYGSALVSMTSAGSDPHICINGTAYACSSAITFVTSGIMQVYKKAN